MTLMASRAVMALALACLEEPRREWACAMQGEFDAAIEEGRPLSFAIGCLVAAWRDMPKHREGRLVLASHALALGLLVPMAALQIACAIGAPSLPIGPSIIDGMIASGAAQGPYLNDAQRGAVPALLLLWSLLGLGQLRLAWLLLERDWPRAFNIGALIAAATITLSLLMGILFLDATPLASQAGVLAIEFGAVIAAARGHLRAAAPRLAGEPLA